MADGSAMPPTVPSFLRSAVGRHFLIFAMCCGVMSVAVGVGSYYLNLSWFVVNKGAEKVTAAELVDAFVSVYTAARTKFMTQDAPVPASFRAQGIDRFNQKRDKDLALHLLWVGPPGREIVTAPQDEEMSATVAAFTREANPEPATRFVTVAGAQIFRTMYPVVASQEACVDCHNQIQAIQINAGQPAWHLNDVMGAAVLDVPAAAFLRRSVTEFVLIGLAVFLFSSGVGLVAFYLQYKEFARRPVSEASLLIAKRELEAANATISLTNTNLRVDLVRKERLSTLGELTATMAHELRNPLSAIRNSFYTIKEAAASSGLDAERPIARVERSITRCDRIISGLLDYTKLRQLNRTEVELDAWLSHALNEQKLPEHVVMHREFDAPGRTVEIDEERMRSVVNNIVENAVQAMAGSDAGARIITASTRLDSGTFEIAIADTGPGIPKDVLPNIFEPLFTTKSFGTGLGLSIVKQIVEQHGATVEIVSEVGHGTRVSIKFPAAGPEASAA